MLRRFGPPVLCHHNGRNAPLGALSGHIAALATTAEAEEIDTNTMGSELTAIEIRERQAEGDKRLRRDAAVSVLTFIGVPVGFLVAFFSINATQVNTGWSIFSMRHYLPAYVAAGLLALAPLVAFAVLNGRALRRSRKDRQERQARLRSNSEVA